MKLRFILPLSALTLAFATTPGHAQRGNGRIPQAVADTAARQAPDVSLRDRWRAPFAVSSSGRVEPREPRQVTIIGADPAIAAGLSQPVQEPGEASTPAPTAEAGTRERVADTPSAQPGDVRVAADTGPMIHRIRPGETWSGIATRYGISPNTLEEANPETDPRRIRVGQLIAIPDRSTDNPRGLVHRVERGESLWEIARRYDVSPERIRETNGLDEDDRLRPGQTLIIPGLR